MTSMVGGVSTCFYGGDLILAAQLADYIFDDEKQRNRGSHDRQNVEVAESGLTHRHTVFKNKFYEIRIESLNNYRTLVKN